MKPIRGCVSACQSRCSPPSEADFEPDVVYRTRKKRAQRLGRRSIQIETELREPFFHQIGDFAAERPADAAAVKLAAPLRAIVGHGDGHRLSPVSSERI